ncbi:phage major capsid protein [Paenibacillus sp. sptzw28]|uniref:phage major capsid protein n=1 Tax=Paenibacillus sp. sptzw28 TaxID=715179 RepID=UPI001C6E9D49|nr:phage major capsid protein [Paenibacillus sp. sptzw28]QYR20807.1 phage major capsid protein [Paenibacillus sp. sptzw28]
MGEKLKKMLARQDALLKDMRALSDKDGMTDEDIASYEAMEKEYDNNEKQIGILQKQSKREADDKQPVNHPVLDGVNEPMPKPYKSLAAQLKDIRDAAHGNVSENLRIVQNAMGGNTQVGQDGGFAVQTDFAGMMMESAASAGNILPRLDSYQVTDGSNSVKWVDIDEDDVSDTVFGGVKVYWASEAATVAKSQPKLQERELKLEKLMGFAYATYELDSDSSFINTLYTRAFELAIRRTLEGAIISGDGVGKPIGILKGGSLVSVAKEAGQEADSITWANLSAMYHRAFDKSNSIWLAHPDTHEQFDFLSFPVGTGGVPVYLPATQTGTIDTLRGRSIVDSDHCSELGEKGDIIFADLSQYMLAYKGGVDAATSIHVQFLTAENCFRFIFRANGMPKRNKSLKIKNSTKNRSSFITLDTRA